MKKRNVLAFMLCVWSVCSWAQKVTVSGTVIAVNRNLDDDPGKKIPTNLRFRPRPYC